MHFIINKKGKVKFSSEPLKKGLNIIGDVNGVMVPGTFELRPIKEDTLNQELSPVQLNGAALFIYIKNENYLEWVSPDLSGICDVFWGKLSNDEYVIGDNFFEVSAKFSSVTLDKENTNFLLQHGYFSPGKTFLKEVFRVKVGNKLIFQNNNFIERDIWKNLRSGLKRNYQIFKEAFLSAFSCEQISDDDAILLSGGCDSGLIAAISALRFSKHPRIITLGVKQGDASCERDVVVARKLADFLGLEHFIPELDYNKAIIATLSNYVQRMPLSPHYSMGFFRMLEGTGDLRIKKIWSGQNADSLYDLGPGGDGRRNLLTRFYLSKNYIRTLSDIKNHSPVDFLYRIIGESGNLAFKIKEKREIRQPKNFQELLSAFESSKSYLGLVDRKNNNFENKDLPIQLTSSQARERFFERKVQTFILGGDPRVIHTTVEIFGLNKAVLPYAAVNMMHFFKNLEINLLDIIKPKRFIYRFLKEIIGNKNFKKIYSIEKQDLGHKSESSVAWTCDSLFKNTKFGQELSNFIQESDLPLFIKNNYNLENMDNSISIFWVVEVIRKIKELGVELNFCD